MDIVPIRFVHAQTAAERLIGNFVQEVINPLIVVLVAAAIAVFLWGVVDFIAGSSDEARRSRGKLHMLWGVVGIFIMVSALGIMNLLCQTIECS